MHVADHTTETTTSQDTTPVTPASRLRYGSHPSELNFNLNIKHAPSALSVGDHVFERSVVNTKTQWGIDQELAKYRRRVVTGINRVDGEWWWEFKHRMPASERFVKILLSDAPDVRSYPPPRMPDFPKSTATYSEEPDWTCQRWECRPDSPPEVTGSPKSLSVHQLSGSGSRTLANQLLAGGPDGGFDHILPGVQKWKYAFVATRHGSPYSIAILSQPYNSDTGAGTGDEVLYLSRLCNHPNAPKNTSSWFIGQLRNWLRSNTDVVRLIALAGIDNNEGIVYKAAGMSHEGTETVMHPQHGEWTKRRWVAHL